MSRKAANIISAQIIMKPDCVLGLATGSSPVGTYQQLIEWYKKGDLDFSHVTSINLDEYKGLGPDNCQSYRYFMNTNLFDHVNIDKNRTFVPNGLEMDSEKACSDYNQIIAREGGIDLQLLGLGHNGHIGFNEPGAAFEKETHCIDLTESTIEANKRFFASRRGRSKAGLHHGYQKYHAGKKNPGNYQRGEQSRYFKRNPLRTNHSGNSGFDSSASQRRNDCRRRSSSQQIARIINISW